MTGPAATLAILAAWRTLAGAAGGGASSATGPAESGAPGTLRAAPPSSTALILPPGWPALVSPQVTYTSTLTGLAPAPTGTSTAIATGAVKPKEKVVTVVVPFDELHSRASLVLVPTAYAAHVEHGTGENLEVFLAWYIGTLYNEKGLFIAPIFSLLVGADAKWALLEDRGGTPGFAIGYYGGLGVPFTGGQTTASSAVQQKQALMHDGYGVLSKRIGPVALTAGGMYGIKKALPLFFPMLRNTSYNLQPNPPSLEPVTAFAGADLTIKRRHFKLEVLTVPKQPAIDRPILVNAHGDDLFGVDFAYLHDRFGYEIMGYYELPFFRWPDKKRLTKEVERQQARAKTPL